MADAADAEEGYVAAGVTRVLVAILVAIVKVKQAGS